MYFIEIFLTLFLFDLTRLIYYCLALLINEYMCTPKCEAKNRAKEWFNLYIEKYMNNPKAQPPTLNIWKQIHPLLAKPIDNSSITSYT
jgi:hypothetical protein